jgi:aminopeptidase N
MNLLYLNARGMDIKSVEVLVPDVTGVKKAGSKVVAPPAAVPVSGSSYKYENDSLKIQLGKTFTRFESYQVVINYVSKPNELKSKGSSAITDDRGLYFINPTSENEFRMPQIWTQGETQATSVWMPTTDSPNEKMTQEIFMKVEDRFTTLSNGLLVGSVKNGDGTRTDHWMLDQPHAPYLAMMAVGEFVKVTGEPWNGKEISYYVERMYEPHAVNIFGDTREMVDFYSKVLGVPFAWPKYAQIAVREYVSGAMENTSATLHADFVVYQTTREMIDEKKGTDVISHELFHQWFGDLVTSESWSNLPLNESFATYGEYLWREHKDGRAAADYHSWQSRQGYLHSNKEVNLIRFNYDDKEDMFDAFSYNKGGQVLHMLRKAVGDSAFFASLRNYLLTNQYKPAEIHHLRLAFEETTGQDMNWFFNQWFLNKGRPKLKVSKKYDAAAQMIELTVEQQQDLKKVPLYKLPLELDIYVNEKPVRTRIVVEDQRQVFRVRSLAAPLLVNFDAERQLLCDLEYEKTQEEYIFQYNNGPLFGDRYEALEMLAPQVNEPPIYEVFARAAMSDKFYAIRNYAIGRLTKVKEDPALDVRGVLMNIYESDKSTLVRAAALDAINKRFVNDPDVQALNERALGETSYAICGAAMTALTRTNPKLALGKASKFAADYGKDIVFPVANLYATYGGDDHISYFRNVLPYITGFETVTFISYYAKTAIRCTSSVNAISAARDLASLSVGAGKFTKYAALKGLKDLAAAWEVKELTVQKSVGNAKRENRDATEFEKELKLSTETKNIINGLYEKAK